MGASHSTSERPALDAEEIERVMAGVEKIQQLAGHFPSEEDLAAARAIAEGKISLEDALAELDRKYRTTA
ncbi:hypothetical protein [Leekyejoonella antrihumi]|uniref:Antitoxin VbhA domain-containing protein n=1 Tax=Leekyejoonella antrihumi TaxID=1660198 RepID=A0A563E7U8_9MICO|nr:hypothetical protein [Leekyejoonella antrihumi]TWP38515.1 hypothetical protein FGL98_01585 [Leekyejoonella antrihumi]